MGQVDFIGHKSFGRFLLRLQIAYVKFRMIAYMYWGCLDKIFKAIKKDLHLMYEQSLERDLAGNR